MSVTVLSIEVKLERDQQDNKIKVYVKNPYSKDVDKIIELKDDDDSSFKTFTDNLAPVLTTLHSVLPHKSKSFFKSTADKEAAAEETRTAQEEILGKVKQEEPVIPTSDNEIIPTVPECGKFVLPGIDKDIKNKLQALINKNKENVNNKKLLDAKIDKALKKIPNIDSEQEKLNKIKKYMDCASYLGQHLIEKTLTDVFFTKDGIITDGYAILPFKIAGTVDNPAIVDPGSIASLWKLDDGVDILGNTIKLRFGVSGNTMYEVAVSLFKKYKTYEISDITFVFDTTNSVTFMTNTPLNQYVDEYMKNKITKLIEASSKTQKPDYKDIEEQINLLFKSNNETNERLKDYCISIVSDQSTEYLGRWTINTIKNQHIFLTKDGIITDGYAILPFQIDEKDGKPSDPIGLFRPYVTLWKIPHTDGTSPEFRSEYDAAVVKMKTEHKYGGSKTSSQRPIKTKTTRRIRPYKTKI